MSQLKDLVKDIVDNWVSEDKLFTALDVSLKVKETDPKARHREVRDLVRAEYANMQASAYGRTPIDVTLEDGSVVEAMLYHPLSDSWDLDNKYSAQQRTQTLKPVAPTPAPVVVAAQKTIGDLIKQKLNVSVTPVATPVAVMPQPPAQTNPNKHLWDQLFDSAPSLFPGR